MTSRERVRATMRRQPEAHFPCAPLKNIQPEDQRWGKRRQFPFGSSGRARLVYRGGKRGTDLIVQTGLGSCPAPGVTGREGREGEGIHRTGMTLSAELHATGRYDERWLPGLDMPFFPDYSPSHFSEQPWIKTREDVACLRPLLLPPRLTKDLASLRFHFEGCRQLASHYQVALCIQAGLGMTGAVHMFGPDRFMNGYREAPTTICAHPRCEPAPRYGTCHLPGQRRAHAETIIQPSEPAVEGGCARMATRGADRENVQRKENCI